MSNCVKKIISSHYEDYRKVVRPKGDNCHKDVREGNRPFNRMSTTTTSRQVFDEV